VTDLEITALAAHLGLAEADFIQRHTRLRPDRQGLALEEQADGACIFLADGACRVQAVKPQQCRDFPHHWTHPDAAAHCRARPIEVGVEEYEVRIKGISA
jgi:Fe-S-cluster containining protein